MTAVTIAALSSSALRAQAPKRTPDVVARDSGAVMERVAAGAYAIIHDDATDEWPNGNVGVIVGDDAVLVIDSNYLPSRAALDIALIRRVTDRPVRYLLNTHWHGDHTHGNGVYRDAFPGLTILGPRESAGFIALNQLKLPTAGIAPNSAKRKSLAQLETQLARGRDSAGKSLSDSVRRELSATIRLRRDELTQLARVAVAPPNLLFERALALDLGHRKVDIRNMGPANSPADVIVYIPAERVLFTGDIEVLPVPYALLTSPLPWMNVLRTLAEEYPVAALVPGHGPVQADHAYTKRVLRVFESIRAQVDSLFRLGYNLDRTVAAVDVRAMRAEFPQLDGSPTPVIWWDEFAQAVARQTAECVQGYRCLRTLRLHDASPSSSNALSRSSAESHSSESWSR
jgi:cyclase